LEEIWKRKAKKEGKERRRLMERGKKK